ncbi:acyl-CoA dehydrogenase NM domain-like protein [Vararia minispora EC-137]|uniref:Acyl-CoA dehydrogenase NM domain-like protein n=1 Tax=Vararia minispora EC-137 TaxID=1314806 RepID=A0ACB8QSW1_9AGAM|nr:acyl-CoA dehydrogenase NM domain-like protein [Vararia minispora EC-137]
MPLPTVPSLPAFDPALLTQFPFAPAAHNASKEERVCLSYARAKAIASHFDLTQEDIRLLTPNFWKMHLHPIMVWDGAATTLLTIQYNLVVGTLLQYTSARSDLLSLIDDLLKYRKAGQFMLTERGHGLDAENLETTATLLVGGGFLLQTPSSQAAKFMPPSVPAGMPTMALVFARLMVDGEFRGIRPFIVDLNDGVDMSPGVSTRLLPQRGGTTPVNHCITSFNVRLPPSALLGPLTKSTGRRGEFQRLIWRVSVGSLSLSTLLTSATAIAATIGYRYSLRRTIGRGTPIFAFRTQQAPILITIAHAHVMLALSRWSSSFFSSKKVCIAEKHAIATAVKAAAVPRALAHQLSISERCGAQGLFDHNQISRFFHETRGISIAEGDTLMLCVRLTLEILLGRCSLPPPVEPSSLLSRLEGGLFAELSGIFSSIPSEERLDRINRQILPRCQPFVEAVGHRMAYDAAQAQGVPPPLIDVHVATMVRSNGAWFAEHVGLGHRAQLRMEEEALDIALPDAEDYVVALGVEPYVSAPIVADKSWDAFEASLQVFGETTNLLHLSPAGRGVLQSTTPRPRPRL